MFYTDIILVCCIVFGVCLGLIGWGVMRSGSKQLSTSPESGNSKVHLGKTFAWIGCTIAIGTLIALIIMLAVQH